MVSLQCTFNHEVCVHSIPLCDDKNSVEGSVRRKVLIDLPLIELTRIDDFLKYKVSLESPGESSIF